MSQSPYLAEPSPDPFERFPVYAPAAEPDPEPSAQLPVPFVPPAPLAVPPQPSYPVATPALLTDQQPVSTTLLVVSWVVAVVTGFYMLPWAIAVTRGKSNQWAIFAGTLLLGWPLVDWIVALVKACGAHQLAYAMPQYVAITPGPAPAAPSPAGPPAGWYPLADGSGSRYWDGQAWTASVQR